MTTDRELLTLAAKAAGIVVPTKKDYPYEYIDKDGIHRDVSCGGDGTEMNHWNPLTNDGDALRLAVGLHLRIDHGYPPNGPWYAVAERNGLAGCYKPVCCVEDDFDDEQFRPAATRRAIVRAAAEIGRKMP